MRFNLSLAASRGDGRCLGLWDASGAFVHATIEEESECATTKELEEGQNDLETLESNVRCPRYVRETLCDGHRKVLTNVPCVAFNETKGLVGVVKRDDSFAESHDSFGKVR